MNLNDFCVGGIVGSVATSLFYAAIVWRAVRPAKRKTRKPAE